MSISVLIPAYNAAKTIEAALLSVFSQTVQPNEIIVLLDGGTDDTLDRIERFKDRIKVARQENHGLAYTRNRLVEMAKGEILAFLDSDDLWHPKYLHVQQRLMTDYPNALVSFVGHIDFTNADYAWKTEPDTDFAKAEWMDQADFFKRYVDTTGLFGSLSFSCVPKCLINRLGPEPFQFGACCDCYLFYQVSLLGGTVLLNSPLAAYRLSEGSMSANRLTLMPQWIAAFEKMEPAFQKCNVKRLREAFPPAYAAKRRHYAKLLLGAGRLQEARDQLLRSMSICQQPATFGRSFTILAASWLPRFLQPQWPSAQRANTAAVGSDVI